MVNGEVAAGVVDGRVERLTPAAVPGVARLRLRMRMQRFSRFRRPGIRLVLFVQADVTAVVFEA